MYCNEESTCNIVWTFWRPSVIRRPRHCALLVNPLVSASINLHLRHLHLHNLHPVPSSLVRNNWTSCSCLSIQCAQLYSLQLQIWRPLVRLSQCCGYSGLKFLKAKMFSFTDFVKMEKLSYLICWKYIPWMAFAMKFTCIKKISVDLICLFNMLVSQCLLRRKYLIS